MKKILSSRPEKSFAFVWDGVLLYAPSEIKNTRHSHFAATVLISLDKPLSLGVEGASPENFEIAVLAPNVSRETDSNEEPLIDFLIDPDDPLYCYLHPLLGDSDMVSFPADKLSAIRPRFAEVFAGNMDCTAAKKLLIDVLEGLNPWPLADLPWDARVQQANQYMRSCLPDAVPGIPEVAEEVGLSESRLMHLFREQMGLPVRQYLLWLRIRQSMRFWAEGRPLAEVALAAGFYDQSHFTRTIRRMTDYAPSMISDPENMIRQYCDCS